MENVILTENCKEIDTLFLKWASSIFFLYSEIDTLFYTRRFPGFALFEYLHNIAHICFRRSKSLLLIWMMI